MYWSWKLFLLLVYFELKCSLFGFFKMLRMKIRITGLQLQTARTEINNKQKKRKYFLIFNKKTSFWNKTKQGELCCGKFIFSATFFLPIKGSRNNSVCSFKSIDNTYWIIKFSIKIWILINMDILCVYFQTVHWIKETKSLIWFVVLSKYIRNHSKNQNLDFGYIRENKEKS